MNDDGSEITVIEDASEGVTPQALYIRVGSVWNGDTPWNEPGIWVTYQEGYQQTPLSGPVLITSAAWRHLVREVESRLRRRESYWKKIVRALLND